jgi:hypothetical protein
LSLSPTGIANGILTSLYHTTTGEGQSLVESVFQTIKDGTLGSDAVKQRAPVPA